MAEATRQRRGSDSGRISVEEMDRSSGSRRTVRCDECGNYFTSEEIDRHLEEVHQIELAPPR